MFSSGREVWKARDMASDVPTYAYCIPGSAANFIVDEDNCLVGERARCMCWCLEVGGLNPGRQAGAEGSAKFNSTSFLRQYLQFGTLILFG